MRIKLISVLGGVIVPFLLVAIILVLLAPSRRKRQLQPRYYGSTNSIIQRSIAVGNGYAKVLTTEALQKILDICALPPRRAIYQLVITF
ncbi:MAG: hypothetical protein GYA34_09540 [Chloroflexi bacterium]|nr:hypothetical protein [Chloroflexota bacterium]